MLATVVDRLTELDDHAFTERFRDLELAHRRLEAEMAAIIAEGERRNIAAVDDHHSMKGWLKAKANANWSNAHVARIRKHYTAKRHTNGRVIYYRRDGTAMLPVGRRHPDNLPEPDEQMLTRLARARVASLRPAA